MQNKMHENLLIKMKIEKMRVMRKREREDKINRR
jgi:hypothetical protein